MCVCLQEIPKDIEGDEHKAIFYRRQISSAKYMFESSLYRSYYLGFDDTGDDDYKTLILRHKGEDEVDERCNIELEECWTAVNVTVWHQAVGFSRESNVSPCCIFQKE